METESIQGKDVVQVFKQLKENRTLVKVNLPEKALDGLTVVSDLWIKPRLLFFLKNRDEVYFRIDEPEGLMEALTDQTQMRLKFEFSDRNRLAYSFETQGGEVDGGRIWLKLPEVIQRLQRRLYFRLDVPAGTCAQFDIEQKRYTIALENISVGGALAAIHQRRPADRDLPMFTVGQAIDDLRLHFPPAVNGPVIAIPKAVVQRMQKESRSKKHCFALHFGPIDPVEEKQLTRLIYQIQRQRLSRRLPEKNDVLSFK